MLPMNDVDDPSLCKLGSDKGSGDLCNNGFLRSVRTRLIVVAMTRER